MSNQATRNLIAVLIVVGTFAYTMLYPDRYTIKDFFGQLIPFLSGWLMMDRPGQLQSKIEKVDSLDKKEGEG